MVLFLNADRANRIPSRARSDSPTAAVQIDNVSSHRTSFFNRTSPVSTHVVMRTLSVPVFAGFWKKESLTVLFTRYLHAIYTIQSRLLKSFSVHRIDLLMAYTSCCPSWQWRHHPQEGVRVGYQHYHRGCLCNTW